MSDDKNIIEEPIAFYGQLDESKSYTYVDYMKWQFDERVELIKGKILKMAAAPSRKHQITSGNLHFELSTVFRKHKCQLYPAPFDVRLPIPNTKGNAPALAATTVSITNCFSSSESTALSPVVPNTTK